MDRETIIPYLELSWIFFLLLPLPLLRVNRYFNPFIFYSYILAVIQTQKWFYRTDYGIEVQLWAENQGQFYLILLCLFVLFMKARIATGKIRNWLAYFGLFNITLTVILMPFNEEFISGLVLNKSMNATLNLMLLPFVIHKFQSWAMVFLCLATISISKSYSTFLALAVMLFWCFRKNKIVLCSGIVAACVLAFYAKTILDAEGYRLSGWLFFLSSFTPLDYFLGRGPGTFAAYSVGDQNRELFKMFITETRTMVGDGLYIWGHSDPIQAHYEYGLIGVLMLIPGLSYCLWALKGPEFYSLLALLTAGLLYYPMHWPIHLIVVFSLLKVANNNYTVSAKC